MNSEAIFSETVLVCFPKNINSRKKKVLKMKTKQEQKLTLLWDALLLGITILSI